MTGQSDVVVFNRLVISNHNVVFSSSVSSVLVLSRKQRKLSKIAREDYTTGFY